ncbi:hypothetical protein ACINB_12130 [Acidovorax sp. NB1]|nr:hypothetical protein ACINB_12130 [Acidovorax sp. NB1]
MLSEGGWVDGRAHVCGPCFNAFVLRASLAMIARAKDVQVWVFAHLGCIRRAMALIGGGAPSALKAAAQVGLYFFSYFGVGRLFRCGQAVGSGVAGSWAVSLAQLGRMVALDFVF